MKILTPGHRYELEHHEGNVFPPSVDGPLSQPAYELCLLAEGLPASEQATAISLAASALLSKLQAVETGHQVIQFIHKEPLEKPSEAGQLRTVSNGTTNEELLRVLIDRMGHMQAKFPCRENAIATTHFETGLLWLEKRTADRKARGVEGKHLK